MQKKTKTYLLLILVLGIWGTIAYKIVTGLQPDVPEVQTQQVTVQFKPANSINRDTFSITLSDRDPFLGTLQTKKKSITQNTTPKKTTPLVWPPIIYAGMLNKQNKNQLFIITIGQEQFLVKKGQTISDIKLLSGNEKSITISYKGNRKTFTKS